MIAPDTNILIHAANANSPLCERANVFLRDHAQSKAFALCELNLMELYMALRNPAIFSRPLGAKAAHDYCAALKSNQCWQIIDHDAVVTPGLWDWAGRTKAGFRRIIDARIALTLLHHGVTELATINTKDFKEFPFARVWNPLVT